MLSHSFLSLSLYLFLAHYPIFITILYHKEWFNNRTIRLTIPLVNSSSTGFRLCRCCFSVPPTVVVFCLVCFILFAGRGYYFISSHLNRHPQPQKLRTTGRLPNPPCLTTAIASKSSAHLITADTNARLCVLLCTSSKVFVLLPGFPAGFSPYNPRALPRNTKKTTYQHHAGLDDRHTKTYTLKI